MADEDTTPARTRTRTRKATAPADTAAAAPAKRTRAKKTTDAPAAEPAKRTRAKKTTDSPAAEAAPEKRTRTRSRAGAGEVNAPASATAVLFIAPEVTTTPPARPRKAAGTTAAAKKAAAAPADAGDAATPVKRTRTRKAPGATEAVEPVVERAPRDDEGDDEGGPDGPRRRRRRGRRGRGRGRGTEGGGGADGGETADAADDSSDQGSDTEDDGTGTGTRRRRVRRRAGEEAEVPSDVRAVVKVREPAKRTSGGGGGGGGGRGTGGARTREPGADGVQGVRGSTRLEAKRQRRREGRDAGRRRAPVVTEAEFLARREAVERVMLVHQDHDRTQIAVLEDDVLVEHYVTRADATSYSGNVYLGKVQNVLPSMEAAFVDIGKGRNAVLYAGEVNYDASALEGRPPRIEQALKSGQQIVVQVTKDPIGQKGARLTSQISLPGRYMVYVPQQSMTGISRKLPDSERARLKALLKDLKPEGAGVIIRTAAEGASNEDLTADLERLKEQWAEIEKATKKQTAPALLHGEPDLVTRVIRDTFNSDFTSLVVEGDDDHARIEGYLTSLAPDLLPRLSKYDGATPLFDSYRVTEQILKALERRVNLPSGGYLVIDRTEAMTVVDVNTGRFTGKGGNLEETVTKNNLEAAEEVVRQLRLRDVGGIIVIDFIDMILEGNRELVVRRLTECLGRDRTKHQVSEITSLGLLQLTRKRVGQGLVEAFLEPCPECHGRGLVRPEEAAAAKAATAKPVTPSPLLVAKAIAPKPVATNGDAEPETEPAAADEAPDEPDTPEELVEAHAGEAPA